MIDSLYYALIELYVVGWNELKERNMPKMSKWKDGELEVSFVPLQKTRRRASILH